MTMNITCHESHGRENYILIRHTEGNQSSTHLKTPQENTHQTDIVWQQLRYHRVSLELIPGRGPVLPTFFFLFLRQSNSRCSKGVVVDNVTLVAGHEVSCDLCLASLTGGG